MSPINRGHCTQVKQSLGCGVGIMKSGSGGGSAFSPTDVSSLIHWWDANEGITLGAGNNIDDWTDKVNSLNLSSTPASEPQFAATGSKTSGPAVTAVPNDQMTGDTTAQGGPIAYPLNAINVFTGDLGQRFDGTITDLLVFNADPSAEDRQAVENYFGTKYGITITHS